VAEHWPGKPEFGVHSQYGQKREETETEEGGLGGGNKGREAADRWGQKLLLN
jgi:hypothetical protein